MTWTLTPDDGIINVRAIISTTHQQDQLRNLIAALQKHLKDEPKEITDERDA
jgi:hypothetical protein